MISPPCRPSKRVWRWKQMMIYRIHCCGAQKSGFFSGGEHEKISLLIGNPLASAPNGEEITFSLLVCAIGFIDCYSYLSINWGEGSMLRSAVWSFEYILRTSTFYPITPASNLPCKKAGNRLGISNNGLHLEGYGISSPAGKGLICWRGIFMETIHASKRPSATAGNQKLI